MSKDQNLSLDFGGVEFNESLLSFMEFCIRAGIPKIQQAAMSVVQDYVVEYSQSTGEHEVGYEAKRSTYGRKQHLNNYEEFRMQVNSKPQFSIFSEYANDPHHRVDATNTHHAANGDDMAMLMTIIDQNSLLHKLGPVVSKLHRFCDEFTTVEGEAIYGWWFNHEHGMSMVGIDLRSLTE